MKTIVDIANQTIKPASMGRILKYTDGITQDIINEIIETHKKGYKDTAAFAVYLKGNTLNETLSNIWHFVKRNIHYKLDEFGFQFVKTPSRTWADKYADCKSYSIFIASILHNLRIPFYFRFVSFARGGDYTHVYIVVPDRGKMIVVDDVMPEYNAEKPFVKNFDYDMTQIYQLSGIPQAKVIDLGNQDLAHLTEGEMDLLIAKDRMKTEKSIAQSIRGIGSLKAEHYQDSIDMLDDAIKGAYDFKVGKLSDIDTEFALIASQAISGEYSLANRICGIGSLRDRLKARAKNLALLKRKRSIITKRLTSKQRKHIWNMAKLSGCDSPTIGFLKRIARKLKKAVKAVAKGAGKVAKGAVKVTGKVAKGVAKAGLAVAKTALKVITLPMRLAIKAILEVTLPKSAPFFLYLFITDQKVLDKMPDSVKKKRRKAEKIANFIVNAIGMKRSHFMGICRNGIMKQYKKSPENVIADIMKNRVSGIGSITILAVTSLISIIKKISSLFGKSTESVSADDAPAASDFGNVAESVKNELIQDVKTQPETSNVTTLESSQNYSGSGSGSSDGSATIDLSQSTGNNSTGTNSSDNTDRNDNSGDSSGQTTAETAASGQDMQSGGRSVWSSFGGK